jgi:hypothetical protein
METYTLRVPMAQVADYRSWPTLAQYLHAHVLPLTISQTRGVGTTSAKQGRTMRSIALVALALTGCASGPMCQQTWPLELRPRAPIGTPGITRPLGATRAQYIECVAATENVVHNVSDARGARP